MTESAERVIAYLTTKGWNSARETASDCGLDELRLDAVLDEIADAGGYSVHKAIRRESYGREVLWLEKA